MSRHARMYVCVPAASVCLCVRACAYERAHVCIMCVVCVCCMLKVTHEIHVCALYQCVEMCVRLQCPCVRVSEWCGTFLLSVYSYMCIWNVWGVFTHACASGV